MSDALCEYPNCKCPRGDCKAVSLAMEEREREASPTTPQGHSPKTSGEYRDTALVEPLTADLASETVRRHHAVGYYQTNEYLLARELQETRKQVAHLTAELAHWKANHDEIKAQRRAILHRTDLPRETVKEWAEMWTAKEAAVARAEAAEAKLSLALEAIAAFVSKYDVAMPYVNNCFTICHVHGLPYNGPTWETEIAALRDCLVGKM